MTTVPNHSKWFEKKKPLFKQLLLSSKIRGIIEDTCTKAQKRDGEKTEKEKVLAGSAQL